MCGIVGVWRSRAESSIDLAATVGQMSQALHHRGPDDGHAWCDSGQSLCLGHRRLSIVDLSDAAQQPMTSSCGRYVLCYNGEIYNYLELREALSYLGVSFRGHSDTEVLLAALRQWGVSDALGRCNGMFAFALWDREERCLTLARDRFGKKPLYYAISQDALLFASELKALHCWPGFDARIDAAAADAYFRFGFVPAARSIYQQVRQVPPGHFLELVEDDLSSHALPNPTCYWSLSNQVANRASFEGDHVEALEELDHLLTESVRIRLRSDVPLGAFLSGGVDSSLVVAKMQALGEGATRTFTIGFSDKGYDESGAAASVARHLGCDHHSMVLDPARLPGLMDDLPRVYDEPFADLSQVPTMLVSAMAREDVTVCLSGDGGDEGFAGYNRHLFAERFWPKIDAVPAGFRRGLGAALSAVDGRLLTRIASNMPGLRGRFRQPGEKLDKALRAFSAPHWAGLYDGILAQGGIGLTGSDELVHGLISPILQDLDDHGPEQVVEKLMLADSAIYLPDDILVKVDRASMGVGLEMRAPLLDVGLVEFAWSLPLSWKLRDGQGKRLLRELLGRYVPGHFLDQRKMGFSVPVASWLRNELREWAGDSLAAINTADGWQNKKDLQRLFDQHESGRRDHGQLLWRHLMWSVWYQRWQSQGRN